MTTDLLSSIVSMTSRDVDAAKWEPFSGMSHVSAKYLFSSEHTVAGLLRLDPGSHEVRHLHVGGEHHAWVVRGVVEVDGELLDAGSYFHVAAETEHAMRAETFGATVAFVYVKQA